MAKQCDVIGKPNLPSSYYVATKVGSAMVLVEWWGGDLAAARACAERRGGIVVDSELNEIAELLNKRKRK